MTTPRWARALIRRIAPPHQVEGMIGDLEEVHRHRIKKRGRAIAIMLTAIEALTISFSLLVNRTREILSGGFVTGSEARLALRLIIRNPIMSFASVVALGVGIGLATTGFTLILAILNPKLPFEGGDRFVDIRILDEETGQPRFLEAGLYRLWTDAASTVEHLGAARTRVLNVLHDNGEIEPTRTMEITPATFRFLPFVPLVGRTLQPVDGERGMEPVALIRENLWERRFGRNAGVVGTRANIGGVDRTIVGVLPAEAVYPAFADVWIPMSLSALDQPAPGTDFSLFGVLPEGGEPTTVQAQLTSLGIDWAVDRPGTRPVLLHVRTVGDTDGTERPGIIVVVVLIGVLVVVAGNVANLIVARTAARRSELAVRTALGASRARLVAQLSLEVLFMGAIAGGLGLLASQSLLSAVVQSEAEDIPPWLDLSLDVRTAAFVILITLGATVVAGVLPAMRATKADIGQQLRGGRGTAGPMFKWFDHSMIVAQIALSIGILGTALMIHHGWMGGYAARDLDIPSEEILSVSLTLSADLPADVAADSIKTMLRAVESAVERIPGIISSSATRHVPGSDAPMVPLIVEGEMDVAIPPIQHLPTARVGSGFFELLDAHPIAGRLFRVDDYDRAAPKVALVNEPLVQRYFKGVNPIGRRLRVARANDDGPAVWHEVVGVVPELGLSSTDIERAAGVYLPFEGDKSFTLLVRANGPPGSLIPLVRNAVFVTNPEVAVNHVGVLSEGIKARRKVYFIIGSAFTALGAVVLVMSLISMYAILSFEVTRRTREIGVRIALGATSVRILQPVLNRVGAYVAVGGAIGTGLGLLLLSLARATLVMRFPSTGSGTFILLVMGALFAALLAAWVPTRKVLAIRPVEALQAE